MKVSDYIATFLKVNGVESVYEMIGGMTAHIIDSIYNIGGIKIISLHHEQAAGFAAEGNARITGVPGVSIATSGPGATNLITAIGSCFFDSVPTIFITGQVNTFEQKPLDSNIRQLGFQETDIVSIVRPITKKTYRITEVKELTGVLKEAFKVALEGRPGPVLIDIPMDIQRGDVEVIGDLKVGIGDDQAKSHNLSETFVKLRKAISNARKPLILVGGGIRSSNTAGNLESFVETIGFPVVYSLMGWDAYCGEKYRVGFIGSYGNRWANFALSECDLLIVLGSRLDVRQTGAQTDVFAKDKTIFHIDCIEDEINNRVKNCVAVNVSLKKFLCDGTAWFKKQDEPINCPIRWLDQIEQLKQKYSDLDEIESSNNINPNFLLRELSKKANSSINYVTDVGQHQMWAAQSIIPKKGQRFVTSGGMGAMGFALPTSIGIHIGSGNPVILIAGDGGFQCNIQELETISKHNFPIKMLVLNNNSLGMVRQFQEAYFDNRYQSTVWGYSAPSFVKVSSAYGIQSSYLQNQEQIEEKLNWFVEGEVPKLLEVNINTETPVNPKLTYGQPLSSMTPPKV